MGGVLSSVKRVRGGRAPRDRQSYPTQWLLVGPPGAGKTTFLRQMKIIHHGGYTIGERASLKKDIFTTMIQAMRDTLDSMVPLGLALDDPGLETHARVIAEHSLELESDSLPPHVGRAIDALWRNDTVQECHMRPDVYSNSAVYYFDNINRLAAEDYVPSQHDIMLLDTKATDLSDITYFYGGQLHRFFELDAEQVRQGLPDGPFSALIAFVDLSTYCQPLTSRHDNHGPFDAMVELLGSMSTATTSWPIHTPLIVMFNKMDVFIQKFTLGAFRHHFPDYDGPDEYERAIDHLLGLFNETIDPLWVGMCCKHLTSITNTTNTRLTWACCMDVLTSSRSFTPALF